MLYIIAGHYGSGKTEVAINLAIKIKAGKIADLDIVNPFFRTKDAEELLTKHSIELVAPPFANTNVDIPVIGAEILSLFQSDADCVVDLGGDDGAVALGQFNRFIKDKPYEMYIVINAKRPLTATAAEIAEGIEEIEALSRLKATGLINNTNVKNLTTKEDILYGQSIAEQAAALTGLPIVYTSVEENFNNIDVGNEILELNLNLALPWEV